MSEITYYQRNRDIILNRAIFNALPSSKMT